MTSYDVEYVKQKLAKYEQNYEVVVFGSHVEGGAGPHSDVDLAVISRQQNVNKNISLQKELLGIFPPLEYDIRVFELLPIQIKISIIRQYDVIFGDPLEISEYFYRFRKIWEDSKDRYLSNQYSSFKEQLEIIQRLNNKQ